MAMITLRVRSAEGVKRVNVLHTGTIKDVHDQLGPQTTDMWYLSTDPHGTHTVPDNHPLHDFHNGDFLYLHQTNATTDTDTMHNTVPSTRDIDEIMSKRAGTQKRPLNPMACRHGPNGMCQHCQPLEPWQTESALSGKHLPIHAHMRRLGVKNVKDEKYMELPQLDKKKKKCDKCTNESTRCGRCGLKEAVQLRLQPYRSVDNLLFCNQKDGIEAVVEEWRDQGLQRFAFLFGVFEPRSWTDESDLGVTARVHVVFQPPSQVGATDGVQLPDACHDELRVAKQAATRLNMTLVGCVYTDLTDDGTKTGKCCPRSHILSNTELLFMSSQQQSLSARRFVTCILHGTADGDIQPHAYMASDLLMALSRHSMVAPCTDPTRFLVKTDTVDFVYNQRNEYGIEVAQRASSSSLNDTIPVDYFIVSVSHGFADTPDDDDDGLGVSSYPPPHMHPSIHQAIECTQDGTIQSGSLQDQFNYWYHIGALLGADYISEDSSRIMVGLLQLQQDSTATSDDGQWTCQHCTFINSGPGDCAMCGLPPHT